MSRLRQLQTLRQKLQQRRMAKPGLLPTTKPTQRRQQGPRLLHNPRCKCHHYHLPCPRFSPLSCLAKKTPPNRVIMETEYVMIYEKKSPHSAH